MAVAIMVVGVPAAATSAAIAVVIAIAGRGAAAGKGGRGDERGEQDFVHRISPCGASDKRPASGDGVPGGRGDAVRSEEHTSELQSLMRISYAVFCLKKKIL